MNFAEGDYYRMSCGAAALDDPAQPRFSRLMRFPRVVLEQCAPPAAGQYAAALRALNVSGALDLTLSLPPGAALSAAALAGLGALRRLELRAPPALPAALPPALLDALPALRELALHGVRPARLPPRLDRLLLRHTGVRELPPEALAVRVLDVTEPLLAALPGRAPRLAQLSLDAPLRELPEMPALERAALAQWADPAPAPLRDCSRLRELTLVNLRAERLPPDFVAACGALELLQLQVLPRLTRLPEGLLRNASRLGTFRLSQCNVSALPPDLFAHSPSLHTVDMSAAGLAALPAGLFAAQVPALRELALGLNALSARDVAVALAPLTALRSLSLHGNPLGDLCPGGGGRARSVSALARLRALQKLTLSRTRLPRVCADWLRDMPQLRRLDLTHNAVRALDCDDLRVNRQQVSDIDLTGNPLRRVMCSQDQYEETAVIAIANQEVSSSRISITDCTKTCNSSIFVGYIWAYGSAS